MTNEYGVVPEPGTVRFERLLPGPIERIWAYLTDSEKRGRWLASGAMELREGGRVTLEFKHKTLSSQVERTTATRNTTKARRCRVASPPSSRRAF